MVVLESFTGKALVRLTSVDVVFKGGSRLVLWTLLAVKSHVSRLYLTKKQFKQQQKRVTK